MRYTAFWESSYAPKVQRKQTHFLSSLRQAYPPQELHFRCLFGLIVNLSKSFFITQNNKMAKHRYKNPADHLPIYDNLKNDIVNTISQKK